MSPISAARHALRSQAQAAWAQRSPRERLWLTLAGVVMAGALLWQVGLAPALSTWREAPERQARLDQQTRQMLSLQAQARPLQKTTAIPRTQASRWLEGSVGEALGAGARIQVQGDRATLTLQAAPAAELALWLAQAREQAQALPVQAQLQQAPVDPIAQAKGKNAVMRPAPSQDTGARWRGTVVLSLP
jgi:general secretion pathway protein M